MLPTSLPRALQNARHVAAGYREKWNLRADYPMVAPNYAARRSEFAKQIGLGRKAAAEQPKRKRAKP